MLHIVLVDDEQLIIHHLIQIISGFDIPHKIVGTATNNEQALTIIRETRPNLVITDIRMGSSNGLDLCETLSTTMPQTKLILLSGYDDFHYAQKAFRYNVFHYLLKPINAKELYEQLAQVSAILQDEAATEAKDFRLKAQIHDCLPMMQEWFFKIIRDNQTDLTAIDSVFQLFDIDILNPLYQTVFVSLSQEKNMQEIEKDFMNVSKLAQTIRLFIDTSIKSIYFYDATSITLILSASYDRPEILHQQSYELADRIRQYLDFSYENPFSIGMSTTVQQIGALRQSVKDAFSASKYSFYIGFNEIICITDVELRLNNPMVPNFKYIQEDLLKHLKLCDLQSALQYLNIYHLNVLQLHDSQALSRNKFLELYYYLSNALNEEFQSELPFHPDIAGKIENSTNLDDLKMILVQYIQDVIFSIEQLRTSKSRKLIDKAKQYIQDNYAHEISLDSIACEIGLSACYLSTLFKNIETVSLKDYITTIRINASKKYLKDIDLKIYEVAANVGYTDSRYFSQLFRKKTGYTPVQYREFIQNSSKK